MMIRNPSRLALLAALLTGAASAATLPVGPGKTYPAPCAAIAIAKEGDTIEIAGGATYSGDVCKIVRNKLTIRGVNGRPKIDAAGKNAAGKGTWVIDADDIVVDNVEMYGATVYDQNGAALRLEGKNFTLRNSFLHDNENGILANGVADSDILIEYSEFGHNGFGGGQTHNLYIGQVKSLTFRYSFSHDANVGHNLKSRAETNTIVYSKFSSTAPGEASSTASGQPSYEIDLPNAGTAYIIGNVIQQPAANQNPAMVTFGVEGLSNKTQQLYVVNNTFLNDYTYGGTFLYINSKITVPALIQNNIFAGGSNITNNTNALLKNNYAAPAPGFVNRAVYDLRPTDKNVIDAGTDPGTSVAGVALAPTEQYRSLASKEARPVSGALDIGAYESTSAAPQPTQAPVAQEWTSCAGEGGYCALPGPRTVRYGVNGKYTFRTETGVVPCFTYHFGDPATGTLKSCSYSTVSAATQAGPVTWTACGGEGATCSFTGTREVRYGNGDAFATKVVTGSILCANAVFGDPAPRQVKTCSYSSATIGAAPPVPAPADTGAEALGAALSALLGRTVTVTIK